VILHVVGARPNFVKAAPVIAALRERGVHQALVHTGQHYAPGLSEVFFRELNLPTPDVNLGVGSGSHAIQTARIMIRLDRALTQFSPRLVLIYGDVNSTLAAALVCVKRGIALGHVEAGLRSGDRTMPEEINRHVVDSLSDWLFTPSEDADANLIREGIDPAHIYRVGNVMIDALVHILPLTETPPFPLPPRFGLITLHRPENVDRTETLRFWLESFDAISREFSLPLIFPVHPRTQAQLAQSALGQVDTNRLRLIDPLGYRDFLAMERRAALVLTDSGGVQEETTYLGVPCLTLRESTERPVTITMGTNILVGRDRQRLLSEVALILDGRTRKGEIPPLWDGNAAERLADVVCQTIRR